MKKTKIELNKTEKLIFNKVNSNLETLNFLNKHFDFKAKKNLFLSSPNNNRDYLENKCDQILSFKKINDEKFINKFFQKVNSKLPYSGIFYGFVETQPNRKEYLIKKYPIFLNYIIYLFDLIFNRILPRLYLTKNIFFFNNQ